MRYPDFGFVDAALGGVDRRNNILPVSALKARLPADRISCYATWHRFPAIMQDHVRKNGSVKGWDGSSYADFLPFDFDGADLGVVLETMREFLIQLEVTYEIDSLQGVRIYFSGKKGFHVLLDAGLFGGWEPRPELAGRLRLLALKMAGTIKIDPAIYDQVRLFRLPGTKHGKSGLWKIPLTHAEAISWDADQLLLEAAAPRTVAFTDWGDVEPSPVCVSAWQGAVAAQTKPGPKASETTPKAGTELFPGRLREGEGRDQAAFKIARQLRDAKVPQGMALEILRLWDSTLEESLVETDGADILEKKISNAYGPLDYAVEGILVSDIKTVQEMSEEYRGYIESLKLGKVLLGWSEVDDAMRGAAPGEVITLIAKSGVGKSVLLQNILRSMAKNQPSLISLFCSLEQPLAQCFERYAQMTLGMDGRTIEDRWTRGEGEAEMAARVVAEMGDNCLTCGRGGLSLDDIESALLSAQEKMGKPVNVLAIDYLGLIDGSDLDKTLYGQVSRAARQIKNIAKKHKLVIILLCQVSRAAGDTGTSPLTLSSARESGAIEESCDFLLGAYRPESTDGISHITLQLLKNRKGANGLEWTYTFDQKSLRVCHYPDARPLPAVAPPPKPEAFPEVDWTDRDELPL